MKALIVGITGQDGSYLAELLLSKGYEVNGIVRRSSSFNTGRIDHIFDRLHLHYGDLLDPGSLRSVLDKCQPDEVYNLGAQSHVKVSFDQPAYTAEVVGVGALHLFEAVREMKAPIKVYQAGSSEMFGSSPPPQTELTPFQPRSPYAVAKVMAHYAAKHYRERGVFVSNGILFNHESPRRGETFVTRKITRAVGRMKHGKQHQLSLGNLDACRDWGAAQDYVEAMWLMLQKERPDDYVIATNESHSVQEFVDAAFAIGGVEQDGRVRIDPKYCRPTEVNHLRGDYLKAQTQLGWKPKTSFVELVRAMVQHDIKLAEKE
jgi:GDPmannose 4,6-dehydratase